MLRGARDASFGQGWGDHAGGVEMENSRSHVARDCGQHVESSPDRPVHQERVTLKSCGEKNPNKHNLMLKLDTMPPHLL